ncbi:MAG: hypothetical protein ACD_75C00450G0002 [uncultured bacterium]|nr:MAG: hypothetical protein ACD_75C00450G0002 [uncultured bacterium]
MKTSAFLIYASILLVFVYLFTMRIQVDEEDDMARFIPQTVLLYLEQQEGADALKRFAASRFGQHLESIDFTAVAQEIGVQDNSVTLIKSILNTYKVAQDDPIFHKVLGKKVAVALMQPVDSEAETDAIGFLQNNTVVVMQPKNPREWHDITGKNSDGSDNRMLSSSQYGTYRIHRVLLGEQPFSLVLLKGFAVLSRNENHLRRCIDTVDGELPALTTDLDFQEIREHFTTPDSFIFVPMKKVRQFISSIGEGYSFPGKDLLLRGLHSTAGFNGLGYLAWRKEERIENKILIRFEKQEVNAFAINYVQTPPVKSSMLSLATGDPMIYYWSNTLNFKNFSMYIEDGAQHDSRLADFLDRLKTVTGKDASSTFALFGEEASMIVEQGPRDALFPFPLGIFFIRVDKIEEFKGIIDKLLQTYDLPLQEEEYGSAWFRYWSQGPQDGLLPLYGFWQDYFFFGNSTALLRRVIDTHGSKISLANIAAVRKIDPGVAEKNNSVTYLNNVQLISMVENFLEVLGTFIAIEDREIAMKTRIVLKKIVNPLLDGAMMYRSSTSRSHITDHMLIIDSVTDISNNSSTAKE